MSHFNGGSPCMVIFSNGSGSGVSSPVEKVSAKGSARLLIQSRCFGSGVFVCAGCFRMGQKQPALSKPSCFRYNFVCGFEEGNRVQAAFLGVRRP